MMLDEIDRTARSVIRIVRRNETLAVNAVSRIIARESFDLPERPAGEAKLIRHSAIVLSGFLISTMVNTEMEQREARDFRAARSHATA